jgi:Ankyrin repeats (many copies)
VAADRANEGAAELLLAHPGIDVNVKDHIGRTPLIIAAFAGDEALLDRLLARPDLEVNAVDQDRQTALAWAALGGDPGVVKALLADPRTNPGITNRPDGRTALEIATAAGNAQRRRSCAGEWPPTPATINSRPATTTSPGPSARRCCKSRCAPILPNHRGPRRERVLQRTRDQADQLDQIREADQLLT